RAAAERDRAAGVAPVVADAEAEMLAVADRVQLRQLAAGQKQRHVRVAEAKRREPRELGTEVERQVGAVHERIDGRDRLQVVLAEPCVGYCAEGLGERL